MILTDRNTTIYVTLLKRDAPIAQGIEDPGKAFIQWWKERCRDYNAPRWSPRGADRAIANRLVNRYGLLRVKRVALMFWRKHSDALVSGEYRQHLVLFAAKFNDAAHDLDTAETTAVD